MYIYFYVPITFITTVYIEVPLCSFMWCWLVDDLPAS